MLLVNSELTNRQNLLNTIRAKLNLRSEELTPLVLVEGAVDKCRLNNASLTLSSLEQALSESSTSHGHREGGRTSTILGLDDLVTTELDAVDQVLELLARNVGVAGLRDQRYDSDTRVATDDCDVLIRGIGLLDFRDEAGGTDDVESSNTEETLGVVDTLALEDLGNNGDSGVDLM